jgi:hypothetical protein
MRPCSVYAKPCCPAGCPRDLLGLLHGPHRVACRLVMVLLSRHGLPAATIAGLLGCDPSTVRRWIHRDHAHGASGLSDRPRLGSPALASASCGCWPSQARGRSGGCGSGWGGRPPGQRTLRRRVREVAAWRRPRLVAKGDPDRDQALAAPHQQPETLPDGAVVLAGDETHPNLLPWVRATWIAGGTRQEVVTLGPTGAARSSAPSTLPAAASATRWPARRSVPASPRSWRTCWPPTRPRHRSR